MTSKLLQIRRLSRATGLGPEESIEFQPGVNVLVGPPNSGKTKWLTMSDAEPFSLISRQSAGLGAPSRYDVGGKRMNLDGWQFTDLDGAPVDPMAELNKRMTKDGRARLMKSMLSRTAEESAEIDQLMDRALNRPWDYSYDDVLRFRELTAEYQRVFREVQEEKVAPSDVP